MFRKAPISAYHCNVRQGASEPKKMYKIDNTTEVIGAGTFGKVYKTHRAGFENDHVAIKVIDKHELADNVSQI